MEPEKLLALIDINNNGSLSQKEVLGFVYCLFKGCEDDKEKAVAKIYAMFFVKIAEVNNLEDGGEIKLEMCQGDASDAIMGKVVEELQQAAGVNEDDLVAGVQSIMAGLTEMGEDAVKEMLGQAAELSKEELEDFVKQEM